MGPFERWARAAAGVLLVLAAGEAARTVATLTPSRLELDIGPSTGIYLEGFTESEERMPATFRWTRERAGFALPLEQLGGNARVTIRYARFLPGNRPKPSRPVRGGSETKCSSSRSPPDRFGSSSSHGIRARKSSASPSTG
jgi:hypothetical protein